MITNPKKWMTLDEFFGSKRSRWDNQATARAYLAAPDKNLWLAKWFYHNLEFGHYHPSAEAEMKKAYALVDKLDWFDEFLRGELRREWDCQEMATKCLRMKPGVLSWGHQQLAFCEEWICESGGADHPQYEDALDLMMAVYAGWEEAMRQEEERSLYLKQLKGS
jgi:hypothetical protein